MENLIIRILTNKPEDTVDTWFNPVFKNYKDAKLLKEETELEGFYVYNIIVEKLKVKYGYKVFSGLCNNISEKTYIYVYGADEELHEWDVDKRVKVSTSSYVVDPTDIPEDLDYMIFLKNEETSEK